MLGSSMNRIWDPKIFGHVDEVCEHSASSVAIWCLLLLYFMPLNVEHVPLREILSDLSSISKFTCIYLCRDIVFF